MSARNHPLARPSSRQAAWIGAAVLLLLGLPHAEVTLYGASIPLPLAACAVAAAVLYPALACYCAHTLHQHVALLDARLKERFDQDARDAVCLFDQRRQAARSRLRKFSGEMVRAAKLVGDIRARLMAAALSCLFLAGAGAWMLYSRNCLNGAAAALLLTETAILLWRCERRIGREFVRPGPSQADEQKLDADIADYDSLERGMLLGARHAHAV